jgi:hypothetical protein
MVAKTDGLNLAVKADFDARPLKFSRSLGRRFLIRIALTPPAPRASKVEAGARRKKRKGQRSQKGELRHLAGGLKVYGDEGRLAKFVNLGL